MCSNITRLDLKFAQKSQTYTHNDLSTEHWKAFIALLESLPEITSTYRDALKAGVPQGVHEQFLPERIRILEVHNGFVAPMMMNPLGRMLDGESGGPNTIVAVTMETGILRASPGSVLHLVFIGSLEFWK